MRLAVHACAFLGALALGREQAAVYAHGVGMTDLIQIILAAAYYAIAITLIWCVSDWLTRKLNGRFPATRRLFQAAEGLMRRQVKAEPDGSGHSQKSLAKLMPTLFGLSLIPSGFWLNVDILRRRGIGTVCAVACLAPCNALSYKAWFYLISLLKVVGLTWVLMGLSTVVTAMLVIAATAIAIDLVRLMYVQTHPWRSFVWQRLKPLWSLT